MKYIGLILIVIALVSIGCTETSDKLTKVDINTLTVPADFNYETARPVDVFVSGLYKQVVRVYSPSGDLLVRGLVDPVFGLHSKISLPYTTKNVKIVYGEEEVTTIVKAGNIIEYSFLPAK